MALCSRCRERWAQSAKLGLCRQCEQALGPSLRSTQTREGIARVAATRALVADVVSDEHPPWRILEVDYRTFYVVWDGSDRAETPVDACRRFREEGLE